MDCYSYITLASVTMATFKALFLREIYALTTTDGESIRALRKGGKFYTMNGDGGQPNMDHPIDPKTIQDKVFVKSDIPQMPGEYSV